MVDNNVLYRRNNHGQPCMWNAIPRDGNSFVIEHGIVGKTIHKEVVVTHRKVQDEITSRIKDKRKAGYVSIAELKDNNSLPVEGKILDYLRTYLPQIRTDISGKVLPMLAKTYDSKIFGKEEYFFGQPKINGLRCFIEVVKDNDMFKPYSLVFTSREGNTFNKLVNLEEYLLSVLEPHLDMLCEEHIILDGELYIPGQPVNVINHAVKDNTCMENKLLQYWCYDVAIENMVQQERFNLINTITDINNTIDINDMEAHLNNKERFVMLDAIEIDSDNKATEYRNNFITYGYEGLILRKPFAEYQFGKRNSTMIKYKKSTDGKFTIVDIYPEGIKRPNIPLLLCKNDINNSTFEVHIGGSFDYQKSILKDRQKYIGKQLHITYGERSGVEQLPFHVKDVVLCN